MANLGVLALLLYVACDLSAQHVSCKTNYYAVKGGDLREIRQSFRNARPWRDTGGHDGFTVWTINWQFNTTYNGSVCRLTTFTTTTAVNITLPRWIMPTNASESLKAEWSRYIQALGQHEYGHAQMALAAAGEMQKSTKQVAEDTSCENLKQRLGSLCEGIVQKYKHMDEAYDQRTEHGINQGAWLGRGPGPFGGVGERPREP